MVTNLLSTALVRRGLPTPDYLLSYRRNMQRLLDHVWTQLTKARLTMSCILLVIVLTSAFKEYWGRAWADYIVYIYISASGVSALLVCMAPHPQITRRHCSKFSVAPLLIWTSKNSSTVKSSVVFESHRRIGKLPGSYSSTVSVGWIRLYHVSAHSPIGQSSSIIFTEDMSSSSNPCWVQL